MSKRLVVPEPKQVIGGADVIAIIKIYADVIRQVFTVIFVFIRRYTNTSYSVGLYLNMNRIIKSEMDLNEAMKTMKVLIRQIAFLKF